MKEKRVPIDARVQRRDDKIKSAISNEAYEKYLNKFRSIAKNEKRILITNEGIEDYRKGVPK